MGNPDQDNHAMNMFKRLASSAANWCGPASPQNGTASAAGPSVAAATLDATSPILSTVANAAERGEPATDASPTHGVDRRGAFGRLVKRLRDRPDSEHEQALIRLSIVGLLTAYLIVSVTRLPDAGKDLLTLTYLGVAYLAFSAIMFLAIVAWPRSCHLRRMVMMAGDFTVLSLFLSIGGESAAPFYAIYLWVALGNGFRYGTRYLFASVIVSVIGFGFVLLETPFWQANTGLGLGLLGALVGIPAYASSLIHKLTEAIAQAESANRAKSRFLARMSHELRTPLNAIIGTSDVLCEGKLDQEQHSMVYTIKTAGRTLLGQINNILDLSKIEAGKVSVIAEDFNLYAMIADLLAIFTPLSNNKQLQLSAHIEADVPPFVRGDAQHLHQVLTNLLANALKFTEAGYVTLQVEAVAPVVPRRLAVRFSVHDSGIGIAPEHHQRIFEQFTQADERINRHFEGSGLGLSITASLIQLLGGSIVLRSTPQMGSSFIVDVPLAQADTATMASPAAETVYLLSSAGLSGGVVADVDAALRATQHRLAGIATSVAELLRMIGAATPEGRPVVLVDAMEKPDNDAHVALALRDVSGGGAILIRIAARSARAGVPSASLVTMSPPITPDSVERALYAARLFANRCGEEIATDHHTRESALRTRRPLNLLVAEDNPVNQRVTRRILEHAGHRAEIVDNGDDALDALERSVFDLFIVDVNMPGMSGLQVVKLYRMAHIGEPPLPIIALTADATPETRQLAHEAGIDAFLTKPIEAKRLLEMIDTLATAHTSADSPPVAKPRSSNRVAQISSHPRYRPEAYPAINWTVIDALSRFAGDDDFVYETLTEYAANARHLLRAIDAAATEVDAQVFRDSVHALRGTSGNVGAESLCRLCQEMHGMSKERLQMHGADLVGQLQREFSRFETEFSHCAARLRQQTSG